MELREAEHSQVPRLIIARHRGEHRHHGPASDSGFQFRFIRLETNTSRVLNCKGKSGEAEPTTILRLQAAA